MKNKGVNPRGGWMRTAGGMLLHMTGVVTVAGIAVALLLAGLVWTTIQETPDVDHLRTVRV